MKKKYFAVNFLFSAVRAAMIGIMESTSSAGTIQMDPNFSQRGHREFFIDSIGKLRIAFCDIAKVYHAQDECIKSQTRSYSERRHTHGQNLQKLEQNITEN